MKHDRICALCGNPANDSPRDDGLRTVFMWPSGELDRQYFSPTRRLNTYEKLKLMRAGAGEQLICARRDKCAKRRTTQA